MNGRSLQLLEAWLFSASATLGVLYAAPAHAQGSEATANQQSASHPPSLQVSIVSEGDGTTASVLLTRVSSWFAREVPNRTGSLERSLEAGSIFAPREHAGIRIWVWLRNPASARLFFAVVEREGAPPRYLVNDVPLERGLDELGLEELGQVVYSSAMALWAGNVESTRQEVEAGLGQVAPAAAPAPAAPVTTVPSPAPAARSTLRMRLGFEYSLRYQGDEGVAQLPSAAAGVALSGQASELALLVHLGVFVPRKTETHSVELSLTGTALAFGADAGLRVADRVWLDGELAPGVELMHFYPRSTDSSSVRAGDSALDVRPLLLAALGARVETAGLYFGVRALTAIELRHTHYDLAGTDGRSSPVLKNWLLQPGVGLQVAW